MLLTLLLPAIPFLVKLNVTLLLGFPSFECAKRRESESVVHVAAVEMPKTNFQTCLGLITHHLANGTVFINNHTSAAHRFRETFALVVDDYKRNTAFEIIV